MRENDLRVIKTRNNIQSTLIELLGEKDFSQITIKDILLKAQINRSTFYKHYADKYELAEKMCDEILIVFQEFINMRFQDNAFDELEEILQSLYQELSKQRVKLLRLFMIHTQTVHLYEDMFNILKDMYRIKSKKQESEEFLDLLSHLYASHVMVIIRWCLEQDAYQLLAEHKGFFMQFKDIYVNG